MIYMTESELKTVGQVKANTIILGDCLKVLPYIADSSISAIITDLPYG
jgi:DNA modification methylase